MSRIYNTRQPLDTNYNVHLSDDGTWPIDKIIAVAALEIVKELRKLNTLMHCHNTTGIPHTLKRIDKRLAKHLPLRPGRNKR